MKVLFFSCFLLIVSIGADAQTIFKCVDEKGRTTFSQDPCADDAQKVTVKNDNAGLSVAPTGDFSKMRDSNAIRSKNRKIASLESQVDELRVQRDQELDVLREKKKYAMNNLAGATWEQSISGEMQAVTDSYNSQIEVKRDQLSQLRQEIRDIRNRAYERSTKE